MLKSKKAASIYDNSCKASRRPLFNLHATKDLNSCQLFRLCEGRQVKSKLKRVDSAYIEKTCKKYSIA